MSTLTFQQWADLYADRLSTARDEQAELLAVMRDINALCSNGVPLSLAQKREIVRLMLTPSETGFISFGGDNTHFLQLVQMLAASLK